MVEVLARKWSHLKRQAEPGVDSHYTPDLVYHHMDGTIVIDVKSISAPRINDILGAFSRGAIQVKHAAGGAKVTPVVIVVATRVGPKAIGVLEQFVAQYLPEFGWGLVDESGTTRLHVPGLDLDVSEKGESKKTTRHGNVRLFSDLNSWMLKILLLRQAPDGMWGGPREIVEHSTHLARVAGVSVGKAHNFTRTFKERGYVRTTRSALQIVRPRALMELWLQNENIRLDMRTSARSILGKPENSTNVVDTSKYDNCAVAGFAACRLHGVLHTVPPDTEIYVGTDVHAAMDAWDLEPTDPEQAHVVIIERLHDESIMRGRVRQGALPVVDILQAALDVAPRPGRGHEQADYILTHVLGLK